MISKTDKLYFKQNALKKDKTPKELARLYIILLKNEQSKMWATGKKQTTPNRYK